MAEKAIMSWSGGKDSALALYEIQKHNQFEIICLQTTITEDHDRVSMHGFRVSLLRQQAESIGLPLDRILISAGFSNKQYESRVRKSLLALKDKGVTTVIFGDIFLEDLKRTREEKLAQVGLKAAFPLWKKHTASLAAKFIDLGFKAMITCVDTDQLSDTFSGRDFDNGFLSDLPDGIDPCGENGEFHSFVFDGPIFKERIRIEKGEKVLRDNRFSYCDVLSAEEVFTFSRK